MMKTLTEPNPFPQGRTVSAIAEH